MAEEEGQTKHYRRQSLRYKMEEAGGKMEEAGGDNNIEYSFAVEYLGPPVSYVVPRVFPVDARRIPPADEVPSARSPWTSISFNQAENTNNNNWDKSYHEPDDGQVHYQIAEDSGATRLPVVTFQEEEDSVDERDSFSKETQVRNEEKEGQRPAAVVVKRGRCHRCGGGNVFTEKVSCLVCNARFCFRCVILAMGSMPEGRKCLSCIGQPVPLCRRGHLGWGSRMLKRILSKTEFRQLMFTERCCELNRIRADHVVVNGRSLSAGEMLLLLGCPRPPRKLAPGRYWYDNGSGLWGKEGRKPEKFISPHLNIGGKLTRKASNGNTGISINGREITKAELRLLRYAGVQYAGCLSFWLDADGTYREEGQKTKRGNLWSKTGTKLYCSMLSLPIPSKLACSSDEQLKKICCKVAPEYVEQQVVRKLLLIGSPGSGTSTIFKQVRILYGKPLSFSEEDLESMKVKIQTNVYQYLCILLEGREYFEQEWLSCHQQTDFGNNNNIHDQQNRYSISPKLKRFSDWFIDLMESETLESIFPAATREYAPIVEEFWKCPAIQATYQRRNELSPLPGAATKYFLERIVNISRPDFNPSEMDIILCDGINSSNGLAHAEFSLPRAIDHSDQHEGLVRRTLIRDQLPLQYQMIRVHTKGGEEKCKWLEMFEDVHMVIFCVALTDYCEYCEDANGIFINKMLASRKLFENVVRHPTFDGMACLLLLTKFDLLEETVEQSPLTICDWFRDFNPVNSGRKRRGSDRYSKTSPAQQAFHYVAVKFKSLFASLTTRKLYVAKTNASDAHSVDEVLQYASVILEWEEERTDHCVATESSASSTVPSS